MMKKNVLGLFFAGVLTGTVQAETVFVTLEKDNAIAVVDPDRRQVNQNGGNRPAPQRHRDQPR